VKRGLLLNIVVGQCATILQLLTCEDEALLVWRDALLILDLLLHVLNRIRRLHIERNRFTRKRLDEDLHYIIEL